MKKNTVIRILTILFVITLTVSLSSCSTNNSKIDDIKRNMPVGDEVEELLGIVSNESTLQLAIPPNNTTIFDVNKLTLEELEIYQKAIAQYDAVVFYDKMISSFIDKNGEKDGQPAYYPENYAGAYINDDGKLIILVTAPNDSKKSRSDRLEYYSGYVNLQEIKKMDTGFKAEKIEEVIDFEEVVYSLNELNDLLVSTVDDVSREFAITGYYVNTFNNRITINIESASYEKATASIDKYRNPRLATNKDVPLSFEIGVVTDPSAYHTGGQGYYYHGSDGGRTLGFTGWYNGQRAYLSCGHSSTSKVGNTAKYGSTTVGTVADKQWSNNGNGDWSIVYLNSSETMGGLIKQNYSGSVYGKIKKRVNSVTKGTIVYHFGHTTQTWSSYEVIDTLPSFKWNDTGTGTVYTILNQVKCVLKTGSLAGSGDSGGPYVTANGNNEYSAVGTHTGENSGYAYFSPMSCVPSNFAVEIGY
jgi:hypothetical protein